MRIADLKIRLLVAIKTKKEKVPMKEKTRIVIAAAAANVVVDTAMLLTYGALCIAHYQPQLPAQCAGISMGIAAIGALLAGIAFCDGFN